MLKGESGSKKTPNDEASHSRILTDRSFPTVYSRYHYSWYRYLKNKYF